MSVKNSVRNEVAIFLALGKKHAYDDNMILSIMNKHVNGELVIHNVTTVREAVQNEYMQLSKDAIQLELYKYINWEQLEDELIESGRFEILDYIYRDFDVDERIQIKRVIIEYC